MPGGCNFGGVRPIDQHVKGFTAMGAKVTLESGVINAAAEGGRLHGANIYLDVVSVGATMNIMMAAALAEGTTVIENVAKEPHIVDLANLLNSLGARVAPDELWMIDGARRISAQALAGRRIAGRSSSPRRITTPNSCLKGRSNRCAGGSRKSNGSPTTSPSHWWD